ncbi:MAG: GGDEF domain-containing protein [Oscillospiraceae bacterium]|nr:GGDEF domain-containing protein [Oscillospiraceae bacterium]
MTNDTECSSSHLLLCWAQSYFSDTTDLMFVKNIDLVYVKASKPFSNMLGLSSPEDVIGKTDFDLFEDKMLAQRYTDDDRAMLAGKKALEPYVEPLPQRESGTGWSVTQKGIVTDADGRAIGVYGIGRDISQTVRLPQEEAQPNAEYKKSLAELQLATRTDSLTGFLNHNAAMEAIGEALEDAPIGQVGALYVIDIDELAFANEAYGHRVGDKILAQTAQRLREVFGPQAVVGRVGDDEFVVFADHTDTRREALEAVA